MVPFASRLAIRNWRGLNGSTRGDWYNFIQRPDVVEERCCRSLVSMAVSIHARREYGEYVNFVATDGRP